MTRLGLGLRKQQGLGLSPKSGAAPSPPYVAKAVHFDPNSGLVQNPSTTPASNLLTISVWLKIATADLGQGPDWFGTSNLKVNLGSYYNGPTDVGAAFIPSFAGHFLRVSNDGTFTGDEWHHYFASWDLTHVPGSNVGYLFFDGIDVANPALAQDAWDGTSQTIVWDGSDATIGGVPMLNASGGEPAIEYADAQIWLNQMVDPSVPANLAKFISGGKPVDPTIAATAFGEQLFLFSGDASTFATNQGTGGAFTLTGTITNASTSPSD